MATVRIFQHLIRTKSYQLPIRHKIASYNRINRNRLTHIGYRTALSAAEPRRRLPIQIYSIKKDVSKMQHNIANADFKVHQFAFFPMTVFVTIFTYTICYIALDPDQIAEAQVEIDMYGYRGFIEHLMDPNYVIGGDDDDDDEDEDDEDGVYHNDDD